MLMSKFHDQLLDLRSFNEELFLFRKVFIFLIAWVVSFVFRFFILQVYFGEPILVNSWCNFNRIRDLRLHLCFFLFSLRINHREQKFLLLLIWVDCLLLFLLNLLLELVESGVEHDLGTRHSWIRALSHFVLEMNLRKVVSFHSPDLWAIFLNFFLGLEHLTSTSLRLDLWALDSFFQFHVFLRGLTCFYHFLKFFFLAHPIYLV